MSDLFNFGTKTFNYSSYLYNLAYTTSIIQTCFVAQNEIARNSSFIFNGTTKEIFAEQCVQKIIDTRISNEDFELFVTNFNSTFAVNYMSYTYYTTYGYTNISDYDNCSTAANGAFIMGHSSYFSYIFHVFASGLKDLILNNTDKIIANKFIGDMIIDSARTCNRSLNRNILEMIKNEMSHNSADNNRLQLIFLIVFCIFMLIIFLIKLLPKANEFSMRIAITIKLLNMIPLNVISEIKQIRDYLMKILR